MHLDTDILTVPLLQQCSLSDTLYEQGVVSVLQKGMTWNWLHQNQSCIDYLSELNIRLYIDTDYPERQNPFRPCLLTVSGRKMDHIVL